MDGPSAATVGLFGEHLHFSALLAAIESHNARGAVTPGNSLILVNSGASEYYLENYDSPGHRK